MGYDRHAGVADERAELSDALPAYELGPVLGRGSFAIVYAARHRWLDRDVAVKRLSPGLRLEDEGRDRFVAEARLLASLDHPHVIRVHDYVESERVCALVMERLRGGTLADRRQVAPPTHVQACAIVIAALHGLEHAHQHGILHRDVKPENILFGPLDTVRVADFGIAKLVGGDRALLTSTDSIIGTPSYMAPEQVDRAISALSAATDVWSAGVVLYELLAGETPYPRGELAQTLVQHINSDPRDIRTLAPDVPEGLARTVMTAITRDPAARYGSALAFADAVEAAMGSEVIAATGVPIHRTPPGPDADQSATLVGQSAPDLRRPEPRPPLSQPGDAERELLRGQPLFAGVPEALRDLVIDSFGVARYEMGAVILEEGVTTDGLYVIVEGRARVVRRKGDAGEITLRHLGPGSSFGAPGLVHERPASATVRASERLVALKLDGAVFRALARMNPEVRALIDAQTRRERLNDFFRMNTPFGDLPAETIEELISRSHSVRIAPQEMIVSEGERAGPMFFVEEGHLRAVARSAGSSAEHDVGSLRAGDYFGEITAATGEPRRASVKAVSECRLLRLDPADVRHLLDQHPEFRARIDARVAEYRYAPIGSTTADYPESLPADARAQAAVPGTVEVAPSPPPADARFGPREPIRRMDLVWCEDRSDSGAACLAMICRHFGRAVGLGRLRGLVGVSPEGTSLGALASGAEALGLDAVTTRSAVGDLGRLGLPAIAHCGANHWVVVHRAAGERVHIADPEKGPQRMALSEFAAMWTGHIVLFAPGPAFERVPQTRTATWAARLLGVERRTVLAVVGLAVVAAATQAALPLLTRMVVDDALPDRDHGLVAVAAIALAGALALAIVATLAQGRLIARLAARMDSAALGGVTDRLLALPARYFNGRARTLADRPTAWSRGARELLVRGAAQALSAGATLVIVTGVMFAVDVVLAVVFLALAPLYVQAMRAAARRLRPAQEARSRSLAAYEARETDAIRGIEAVKSAGAERRVAEALAAGLTRAAHDRTHADIALLAYTGLVQLASFAMLALFLFLGATRVLDGDLSLGGLVAFNSLVFLAGAALLTILTLWGEIHAGGAFADRLREVMDEQPEQDPDAPGLERVATLAGPIRAENLSFRYRGARSPEILGGITFTVPEGAVCAIVGRSGSGKTTLVKCLAALLEPTGGRITYGGTDALRLHRGDLRRQIGFVPQDGYMFDDTIGANIALGDPDPDPDRVRWAASIAKAHGFIDRLPQRYQTRIGDAGVVLSRGQRQRIAIARAVYGRPPLLIFDEVTANMDPESARVVREALAELLVGRTAFVATHRLDEIRDADLILVLDDGQLVEQGTHDELIARRGLYQHLVEQQSPDG